jgi:uncharacterized phage protein gp47/JayE
MAEQFVGIEIETSGDTLADNAVLDLQTKWPGWEPNDADQEVVMIETIAPMAAEVASAAAQMDEAVVEAIGRLLLGEEYEDGTPAVSEVTITLVSSQTLTIDAGAEIDIDGFAFTIDEDVVFTADDEVTDIAVTASENGTEYNDLPGDSVNMITALAQVDTVTLEAPTSGGTDEELRSEYLNRVSRLMRLRARTIVTVRDHELFAMDFEGIGRALAVHDGERAVEVFVTEDDGTTVPAPTKTALEALLEDDEYRLVNTTVTVSDPTYTTITVVFDVVLYPGYGSEAIDAAEAAVLDYLDPANYGKPRLPGQDAVDATLWYNDPVIRAKRLIDVIGEVPGVDYVDTITITGDAGSDAGDDWTMAGTVALPDTDSVATGSIA